MKDWKISRIYSDVSDKVSSVIFAKRIAEEEERRKKTLLIVIIAASVAVIAAVAAATIYLTSKTEDGESRGKVLVANIKSKLPCKKADECECECECEEAVEVEIVEAATEDTAEA